MRAAVLAASLAPAIVGAAEVPVWFGIYTNPKTRSEGVYVARFDTETGAVTTPVLAGRAKNPSFLAFHPRLPIVYAVSEIAAADGTPGGAVEAFAIDDATGALTSRGAESTGGAGPCHVTVDPDGKVVLAANYGGGSVACLGLGADGGLEPLITTGNGSGFLQHAWDRSHEPGIDPKRQERPHAHSVDVAPGGRFAFVCDLGLDEVLVHALDRERATLAPHAVARLATAAGPRHLAIHPDGVRGWCVNELDLTVTGLAIDVARGALRVGPTASTIPADITDRSGFSCAEIAVHPNGKFLYASNRGHDSIAMFRIVDGTTGLELLGVEPTRVKTPRHFAIAPGGRHLLAAGQNSGTVTVFSVDEQTGRLSFTGTSVEVPSPVCIAFRR
ncbi:MAG: lactonase family protein, partial [Planctomycetaceae bacterium]